MKTTPPHGRNLLRERLREPMAGSSAPCNAVFHTINANTKCYVFSNRFPAGKKSHVTTACLTVDTIIHLIGEGKMTIFKLQHILTVPGPVFSLWCVCAFFLWATKGKCRAPLSVPFALSATPPLSPQGSPVRWQSWQSGPLAQPISQHPPKPTPHASGCATAAQSVPS